MTLITIRLVGEQEDRLFRGIDVDNKILYVDLKKEIQSVTYIPPKFQQVQFRGNDLPDSLHPLESINDFEELVVAHLELPWWKKYKESVDIAMKPGRERISNARDAVKLHKRLMENGFFDVYSSFDSFRRQYHHMITSWTDGSLALMKEAARNHFRAKHFQLGADDEKDFVCRFEARSEDLGGSRKNTLVFVQLHNERKETKYNLKCHHYGSSSGSAKGQSPDIKELYGYKLLELIEVGPHVEFVLPNELTGSTTSMYIATKWNESFMPVSRMGEEDAFAEVLVQILLLGTVLQVNDLHADNCGMWGDTKEVAIVDFRPRPNVLYPDVVKSFLHNISYMYWETRHIELLEQCDEATRLAIAKKSLAKWDLLSKVDVAYQQIVHVKNSMKNQDIHFKSRSSPTEDLEQYEKKKKEEQQARKSSSDAGESSARRSSARKAGFLTPKKEVKEEIDIPGASDGRRVSRRLESINSTASDRTVSPPAKRPRSQTVQAPKPVASAKRNAPRLSTAPSAKRSKKEALKKPKQEVEDEAELTIKKLRDTLYQNSLDVISGIPRTFYEIPASIQSDPVSEWATKMVQPNYVDNYGWESSLSMVANEQTRTARHRHGVTLLRPVFINAVEVGYSYAHCDRDKKLNVRGVTIALWHFICRGHQAIALLPYCFKNYAEKSSRYSELMMLYRLNLIEFTPGYGSEKYAEVNRIMVNRAHETGGCLARSQMQGITENKSHLIEVVEQRLLMPTFNGDDIMFPIDGPLGRNGPSLKQTLECEQHSPDWRACSEHQLLLSDQRHWLEKLALLVPEKVPWTRLVQVIQAGGDASDSAANLIGGFDPLAGLEAPTPPSPPAAVVDNPFNRTTNTSSTIDSSPTLNHSSQHQQYSSQHNYSQFPYDGYQHHQQSPHATYHLPNPHQLHRYRHQQQMMSSPPRRYHAQGYHMGPPRHHHQHQHQQHSQQTSSSTRLVVRYGPTGSTEQDARSMVRYQGSSRSKHSAASVESTASTQSGGGSVVMETARSTSPSTANDEHLARSLSDQLLEEEQRETAKRRKLEEEQKKKDETLAKLSQIFGYSKSARVMKKFPDIATISLLVEKCILEADQDGDDCEFEDEQENDSDEMSACDGIEVCQDLIDFSDEPILTMAHREANQELNENNSIEETLLVDYFL